MTSELITIGITCFNAEDSIARAIDSALDQSWPNCEIIIVDDNSTDRSVEIINSYSLKHSAIRLIRNAINKGVSYNRQLLLTESKGKFLAFFDDDDWSFPNRLEKQVARLNAYASHIAHENIICYGNRIMIREGQVDQVLYGIGRQPKEPHGLMVADAILGDKKVDGYSWGLMGTGTMLAPVVLLKQIGGFDPLFRRSAEIDLALRAVEQRDVHFISVDEPIIKQYWTQTADKSLWRIGKYQSMMILKHWKLVLKRRLIFKIAYPYTSYLKKKLGLTPS